MTSGARRFLIFLDDEGLYQLDCQNCAARLGDGVEGDDAGSLARRAWAHRCGPADPFDLTEG